MDVVYLIVCVTVIEDDSSDDCDIDCGLGHQTLYQTGSVVILRTTLTLKVTLNPHKRDVLCRVFCFVIGDLSLCRLMHL